jgi:hypothetical protein
MVQYACCLMELETPTNREVFELVGEDRQSYKSALISVSARPSFYQHLFDITPLPEHKLVLDLFGVIRFCN